MKIRKRFEEKITELVDVRALHLWGYFKDRVFETGDGMCGKKGVREVKETHGGGNKR